MTYKLQSRRSNAFRERTFRPVYLKSTSNGRKKKQAANLLLLFIFLRYSFSHDFRVKNHIFFSIIIQRRVTTKTFV